MPHCTCVYWLLLGDVPTHIHVYTTQLLLEWGADIHIKNRISKTALELTRNADMKEFLTRE